MKSARFLAAFVAVSLAGWALLAALAYVAAHLINIMIGALQ